MHKPPNFFKSTIGRKVLMALTGLVLVLFVMGHMLGNLQIFLGPAAINAYAYKLHHLMPSAMLWTVRFVLIASVIIHVACAVSLVFDNRKARPSGYEAKNRIQASYSARTMRISGLILIAFVVFHIAHFTVRKVPGMQYDEPGVLDRTEVPLVKDGAVVTHEGEPVMIFNVYDMMIDGFQVWWVSLFYIIAVGLLCMHLAHGVSSLFQTLGLRNKLWRARLDKVALTYGWVVFLGFAAIPVSVLSGFLKNTDPSASVAPTVAEKRSFPESRKTP